jgi:hypothetical protein
MNIKKGEGVYCPMCSAYNYPYTLPPPDEGLYCKACKRDMKPTIAAMKQFIEDVQKYKEGEDIDRINP